MTSSTFKSLVRRPPRTVGFVSVTPYFTREQLGGVGIAMALYPLSAFRAMNKAALNVYETLRAEGTQETVIDSMQTRAELYEFLGYHDYESKLDELFSGDGRNN